MPSVLGLFKTADAAADAADRLHAADFGPRDYEVLTSAPYPEGAFGEDPGPHRLFVFPLGGALLGFAVALLLTAGTQLSFPLVTGGKPILAIPPMIVIMYEGTMLGALIFTVLGVIFESRLPSLQQNLYDPRITEGFVGLVVPCRDAAQVRTVQEVFREAGAEDVKTEGRSES